VPVAGPVEIAALRATLRSTLPHYMVPSRIASVAELPRTRNGKLDIPALLALACREPEPPASQDGSWTPTMTAVATIWQEMLPGLDRPVVASDNYFELGGTSLQAQEVTHRVAQECGTAVPLRLLFAALTLADFAAKVERRRQDHGSAGFGEQEVDSG
jgi:nonribosomal peptide synthetase protein BlmIV